MRAALPLALILLCGCGARDILGENKGVTAEQLANLSTPQVETEDRSPSVRLQPLVPADLVGDDPVGAGCDFTREGQLFLAASRSDAIARIDGRLLHLVHSSPANATGAFFEDRRLSISIGRRPDAAGATPAPGEAGGWPARLTVTNRRTQAQSEMDGVWRCAG